MPAEEISPSGEGWAGERTVVVYDSTWQEVERFEDRSPLPIPRERGEEILDVKAMDLPPGDYFVVMKIRDPFSKKAQVFRDEIHLDAYGEGEVSISGIELAGRIEPASGEGRFVKRGLRVLPRPSLTFERSEDVFIYFEVYNLRMDAERTTPYRIHYPVHQ